MDGIRKLAHRGFPIPKIGNISVRKYLDLERIQIRIDASGSTITELTKESNRSYINRLYQMTPYDESTDRANTFDDDQRRRTVCLSRTLARHLYFND